MTTSRRQYGFAWKRLLFLVILILLGFSIWWYCHQKEAKAAQANQFITAKVKRGSITYSVNASGMVYPKKIVKVGAQVSGKIAKLAVNIGDTVHQGDLIAEIDANEQQNAKETAVAQLSGQKASLATAQANLLKAQQAYTRAAALYKKGAGTKEDMEAAAAALANAKNSVTSAQASIRQSQLTIANADLTLGYTKVTAPIDGTVINVAVEEGQTENAVQSSPTLVTLAQTDTMTVKAEIAEADIGAMKAGLPVSFTLLGKNSKTYTGILRSIDPAPKEISDSSTISSSTAIYYYGHIDVPNPDGALRYGMTATIAITVAKDDDALLVPMTALSEGPDGKQIVEVLGKDGQPRSVPVKIGLEDGVNAQVLDGLQAGDAVIISNAGAAPASNDRHGPPGMF